MLNFRFKKNVLLEKYFIQLNIFDFSFFLLNELKYFIIITTLWNKQSHFFFIIFFSCFIFLYHKYYHQFIRTSKSSTYTMNIKNNKLKLNKILFAIKIVWKKCFFFLFSILLKFEKIRALFNCNIISMVLRYMVVRKMFTFFLRMFVLFQRNHNSQMLRFMFESIEWTHRKEWKEMLLLKPFYKPNYSETGDTEKLHVNSSKFY